MRAEHQELHRQIELLSKSKEAAVAKRQKDEAAFKVRQSQELRQEQKEERVRQQKAAAQKRSQAIPSPVVAMLLR